MGNGHAGSGILSGAVVATLIAPHRPEIVAIAALTGGGLALLPDLDSPGSTSANYLGFVTRGISAVICKMSHLAFITTKTKKDTGSEGTHRHLTHSLLFTAIMSALVFWLTITPATSLWAELIIIGLCSGLGIAAIANTAPIIRNIPIVSQSSALVIGVLVAVAAYFTGFTNTVSPNWFTILFTVGVLTHLFGDWCTKNGVPLLWFFPIRGQAWHMFRLPGTHMTAAGVGNTIFLWVGTLGGFALIGYSIYLTTTGTPLPILV